MKKISCILLLAFLAACGALGVSKKETEAVQKVLDYYGGACNRTKGFKTNNGNTRTYFELELSESDLIEKYYPGFPELPGSNAAYLFYSNLGEEQSNYTDIKAKISYKKGESHEYAYTNDDLKEVEELMPLFRLVADKMKSEDYQAIIEKFDTLTVKSLNTDTFKRFVAPYDSAFGKIKETQFAGFKFFRSNDDYRRMVYMAGIIIREKENTPIRITIDRTIRQILAIKFEF